MFKLYLPTICVLCVAILFTQIPAQPLQELPPRKGHVPVYIRVGNTPLSEINPKLAEAFHEGDVAALTLEAAPALTLETVSVDVANAATEAATTTNPLRTESDIADWSKMR